MDRVISGLRYKGTILQRNYRKMAILWSFFHNFFVNFHGKKIWETHDDVIIQFCVILKCDIKRLHCILKLYKPGCEKMVFGVSDQVRLKSYCSATETCYNIDTLHVTS